MITQYQDTIQSFDEAELLHIGRFQIVRNCWKSDLLGHFYTGFKYLMTVTLHRVQISVDCDPIRQGSGIVRTKILLL